MSFKSFRDKQALPILLAPMNCISEPMNHFVQIATACLDRIRQFCGWLIQLRPTVSKRQSLSPSSGYLKKACDLYHSPYTTHNCDARRRAGERQEGHPRGGGVHEPDTDGPRWLYQTKHIAKTRISELSLVTFGFLFRWA